ncbi:MAG: nucleotide exchange factor GrpE [Proteiniphilum sp.]|nr:nucleotide exchange factor GrpE [Proteiniphilum sp.]MDD3967633.1 nucleotide exchange factor GrpE [Proteiniphilum sp.]MDD4459556.1 nucleotide exchange factor GrpE [Proteiniphilum sp.]
MTKNKDTKQGSTERDETIDGEKSAAQDQTPGTGNGDNMTEEEIPLTVEFAQLQVKYEELNNSYLRLHAEFDNFRKRTLKEKAELIKNGGERVLLEIIRLVDDFERALTALHAAEDKDAMLEGMDLIYGKFITFLGQQGVKEIEAIGLPFDAERFEAVTTIPAREESQKGMVIDCIQKGYELNEKIIRFPKVIVGE